MHGLGIRGLRSGSPSYRARQDLQRVYIRRDTKSLVTLLSGCPFSHSHFVPGSYLNCGACDEKP